MTKPSNEDANKMLTKIEGILEANLGVGVFVPEEARDLPRVTTGIEVVDHILGGGLPRGMICEVFGPEATGKTTFFAGVCAANQKLDPLWRCLYLDYEQTVSLKYFKDLGVDVQRPRFVLAQPKTIEEGYLLAKTLMERDLVDQVIWDTPAASQPATLIYGSALDDKSLSTDLRALYQKGNNPASGQIASHASTFSLCLSQLVGLIAQKDIVFCFPNQIRTTINTWGAGETTSGGRALKFYAAVRIRISKSKTTKEALTDDYLGTKSATATENVIQFHCIKNKTAPPFRITTARLRYGQGFIDVETTFDLAVKRKVIDKNGANFTIPGVSSPIRGTDNTIQYLKDKPEAYANLKKALRDTKPGEDEIIEVPDEDDPADLPEGSTTF